MPQKYKLQTIPRADSMLALHVDFLTKASLEAGRRLLTSFKKMTDRLADNPFQFPFADDQDAPGMPPKVYRKCLFEKRYKVIFRVENDDAGVIVVAVIDCRMENKNLFETERMETETT